MNVSAQKQWLPVSSGLSLCQFKLLINTTAQKQCLSVSSVFFHATVALFDFDFFLLRSKPWITFSLAFNFMNSAPQDLIKASH